jgi:hypothetical protein
MAVGRVAALARRVATATRAICNEALVVAPTAGSRVPVIAVMICSGL